MNRFRLHALGLTIGFGIQFLLGMTLNLFVKLPDSHPGTSGNDYFARSGHSLIWALSNGGGIGLTLHVWVAIALATGCLALLGKGIAASSRLWIWTGGIASFFTIGALFNGLSFVDYNHDFSSMIMATCWLGAVSTLGIGMSRSNPARASVKSPGSRKRTPTASS